SKQREALDALLQTLEPEQLWLDPELIALIAPRPPGQSATRELFPRQTGYLFDPLAAAASAAGMTIDQLLDPTRGARLVNYHAMDSTQPAFDEVLDGLLGATWYSGDANQHAELQRVVETTVLQKLIALAANPDAQAQVRAIALDRLDELNVRAVRRVSSAGPAWRAHYRFAADQIQRFLDDPSASAPIKMVAPPPGSPIG
ncbi:MAG: zinc-dependent metalloprotease, partial [Gammaproteobacteria bacterium]|nr:zinc-dependent metalloprotease [Gammaproteobacteria bacterium]